jgi:hypothetical protein
LYIPHCKVPMTVAPQANTEAARPKGSHGMHRLPGPYTLMIPLNRQDAKDA